MRLKIVKRALGPSAGWFARDKVMGRVALVLGFTPESAEVRDGKVHLQLRGHDGSPKEITADHVIAATGYQVTMDRLNFLAPDLRTQLKTVEGAPVLKSNFESSIPGLYFVGLAAKTNFGPVMRFAFGAGFAAETLPKPCCNRSSAILLRCPMQKVASIAD